MAPKLPPPPSKKAAPTQPPKEAVEQPNDRRFAVVSGRKLGAQRAVLYGPGGIGKSSLAALTPNPVFLDVESGTGHLDVPRVEGLETYADLRDCLHSNALDEYTTLVLDSATKAQEMCVPHVLATVPHEKGHLVKRLQDFGFGKELGHIYDAFMLILADLDRHVRAGRNVVLIAHDCIETVPNPVAEDWIQYQPHLQSPRSGKASIRNRVVQWADHVLFIGYDVLASEGKGKGDGTRTIWPTERPDHLAKSRTVEDPMPFEKGDGSIWEQVFGEVAP